MRSAPSTRRLIVNADDFGQSAGVNAGIARAHEHGILTSASLMVRWPCAEEAVAYAREHTRLSVGLHIDLGEWVCTGGEWTERYGVVDTGDAAATAAEILRQLEAFRRLVGGDPTHLDSHQHVHCSPPAERVVRELGAALGIPVRQRSDRVRYVGDFYGQGSKGEPLTEMISVAALSRLLRSLEAGTTELGCHPGLLGDAGGMYAAERDIEVATLCDPAIRHVVLDEGIELISFHDVAFNAR